MTRVYLPTTALGGGALATLTGNPADDTFAVSAGTGHPWLPSSVSTALQPSALSAFGMGSFGQPLTAMMPDVPENYAAASGLTAAQVGDGIRVSDAAMSSGSNQVSSAYTFSAVDVGKMIAVFPPVGTAYNASAGGQLFTAAGRLAPGALYGYITSVTAGKALVTQDQAGLIPMNAVNGCSAQFCTFGHDSTAALNACYLANYASELGGGAGLPGGGGVRHRPAIYCISAELLCDNGVRMVGAGSRATEFSCMTPAASVRFNGRGGTSGGFTIYGNFLAVTPWALGKHDGSASSAHRKFDNIEVKFGGPAAGPFWRTGYWSSLCYWGNCQNITFSNIDLAYGYGSGVVADYECGGISVDGVFEIESCSGYFFQAITSPQTQTFAVTGAPTGGTFTLTFTYLGQSYTTAPVVYNATATQIATAVSTATGGVLASSAFTVSGGPLGTLSAVLSSTIGPLSNVSVNYSGLTGGAAPTVTWTQSTPGWVSASCNDLTGMQMERRGYASDGYGVGGIYIGSGLFQFSGKFHSVGYGSIGVGGIVDANWPNPNPNLAGNPHFMAVMIEKQSNATSAGATFTNHQFVGAGQIVGETAFAVGDGGSLTFGEGCYVGAWSTILDYSSKASVTGLHKLQINACGSAWGNGTGTTQTGSPVITGCTQPFQYGEGISGSGIQLSSFVQSIAGTPGNWTVTMNQPITGLGAAGVALTRDTTGVYQNGPVGLAVANMVIDAPAVPPPLSTVTADILATVDIGEIAPGGVLLSNVTITQMVVTAKYIKGSLWSNKFTGIVSCTCGGKPALIISRQGVWTAIYTPVIQAAGLPQDAPANALTVTYDRSGGSATGPIIATGVLFLARAKYPVPAGQVVTNCNMVTGSTAAVTPTNAWMCIVDPVSLVILAVSTDQLTRAMATDNPYVFPLAATWTPSVAIVPLIGLMVKAATPPTQAYAAMRTGTGSSIAPQLAGPSGALTGQTSPPAVGTSVGVLGQPGGLPFFWLS